MSGCAGGPGAIERVRGGEVAELRRVVLFHGLGKLSDSEDATRAREPLLVSNASEVPRCALSGERLVLAAVSERNVLIPRGREASLAVEAKLDVAEGPQMFPPHVDELPKVFPKADAWEAWSLSAPLRENAGLKSVMRF